MPLIAEIMIAVCLVIGTFFTVVTGIGLLRLPDIFCRMHAAGKAGTLGVVMVIIGAIIFFAMDHPNVAFRGLLAIFFQFLTTPAATHLLARASYVREYPVSERTQVDEMRSHMPSRPDLPFGEE